MGEMMRKDFACIVISHGRPERSTVKVLRECGYTGKIYIVVDDEDKTLPDYIERYGADVHVFHKEEDFDTGDLGGSKACGVFARNQCLKVAEKNNLTYYLELDDDLESLAYRYNDDGHLRGIKARELDRLFEGMCIYFDEVPVQCIGFGNAVDYIGGVPTFESGKANRTVMNSFFLRTSNKIQWRSRNSDDIITVVDEGQKGHAGFRFTPVMNKFDVWIPKRKSNASGGSIDEYNKIGSYKLRYYAVMFHPDCIKIKESGEEYDMRTIRETDEELSEIMMDMGQFGDDLFKDDDTMDIELPEEDNPYSQKKHVPQYEPTGDFVDIMDLIDDEKTNELIKEIKESKVSEDQKNFLIKAAYRHLKFNYSKIADYYSNASEEMQILMEKSALVIIDIDDAIANGYVKLTKVVEDLIAEDDGGEPDGE